MLNIRVGCTIILCMIVDLYTIFYYCVEKYNKILWLEPSSNGHIENLGGGH